MALNAIITAGGRLPEELEPHANSKVKALLRLKERTLLDYSVQALLDSDLFARIVVVGNDEVRDQRPGSIEHVPERDSLVANIQAGFEQLGGKDNDYLILSPDLPFINAEAMRDFTALARETSDVGFVYVHREDFISHFPEAPNTFTKIDGTEMTLGSMVYMTGQMLQSNIPLAHDFYRWRKSPFRLAVLLGLPVALGFVTGRLKLSALEERFSRLSGGEVRALRNAHAGLAYDIDTLANYQHAEKVLDSIRLRYDEEQAEGTLRP